MFEKKELFAAYRLMNRLDRHMLRQHRGMLSGEYFVLTLLADSKESLRSTAIADDLRISFPMTSRYLSRLEKNGLIERNFGKEDKREKIFTVTETGREKLMAIERGLRQADRNETH